MLGRVVPDGGLHRLALWCVTRIGSLASSMVPGVVGVLRSCGVAMCVVVCYHAAAFGDQALISIWCPRFRRGEVLLVKGLVVCLHDAVRG